MSQAIVIHWFRQDLRLLDNPALFKAAQHGQILPIYILDDENAGAYTMGAASRWWLHHSLTALNRSLEGKLSVYCGQPKDVLCHLLSSYKVTAIYWNRCYEPWRMQRDSEIKAFLRAKGVEVHSENGALLWEPWNILKNDNTSYKVFTPFYRKGCLGAEAPRLPLANPNHLQLLRDTSNAMAIDNLALLPSVPWDKKLALHWEIGEIAAQARLKQFLDEGLNHYKEGRNFPAKPYVSRLSPHLHYGEISPNQIWYAAKSQGENHHTDHFCSELGWREFSYSQLYYFPELPHKNLQSKFDGFPWANDAQRLQDWQQGKTGIPMVDAGMRELWQTGIMHNRVRMIVGSFLVKNLLIDWRQGERWFWNCLVDADLASNSASWQWIAGCGADAAPYFRIFNPVIQGQKFDAEGHYLRRFLPELARLPLRYLFCPWEAPTEVLKHAGITLGITYPQPIVDLKVSRQQALTAFQSLKQNTRVMKAVADIPS